MKEERMILKKAIKQVADDFGQDKWNSPYETICHLHKELLTDAACTFIFGILISYGVVGLLVLLKQIFGSKRR